MIKTITIDGKEYIFKSSAAIPRIYRIKFKRDIFSDLAKIQKQVIANEKAQKAKDLDDEEQKLEFASTLPIETLDLFENIAFLMHRHGDPSQPDNIDEWLEQFQTFDIYKILPELLKLWQNETKSMSTVKKKQREIDRELNTPLFMLRCVQLGISIRDLDLLSIGLVNDMFIEKANDDYDYPYIATQEDIDAL